MKTLAKPTNFFTRMLYTPIQSGWALSLVLATVAAGLVVLRFTPQLREGEAFRVVGASPRIARQVPLPPPPHASTASIEDNGFTRPLLGEYYIGVYVDSLDPALAAQLKLQKGIVVRYIVPGSPAEAAGLQPNDLLITAGDEPLDQVCNLGAAVSKAQETELAIEVIREGQPLKVTMTPTKRPAQMWMPLTLETVNAEDSSAASAGKWVYIDPTTKTNGLGPGGQGVALPGAPPHSEQSQTHQTQTNEASAEALQQSIAKLEQELTKAREEVKELKAKLAEQRKDE